MMETALYFLEVETDFAAAHQLRNYKGKCENMHGHNWRVRITVRGEKLGEIGMLMDFGDLKALLKETVERFDHVFVNEVQPFDTVNPTSENLARVIAETMDKELPEGICVDRATVWESEKCSATYRP